MSEKSEQSVLLEIKENGEARVTLNRPHVNNAYDGDMIDALLSGLGALAEDPAVRVIVIDAAGKHSQAGADLAWLDRVRHGSPAENLRVSQNTTDAVRRLDACPKPTIALVQGACFGGGTGLIAACDIVIAADNAIFSIAEVRWGLHAGPIIPQLCAAIGPRQTRRYALTAERFDAMTAMRLGLVHQVCDASELPSVGEQVANDILRNGPSAMAETKKIIFGSAGLDITDERAAALAESHSLQRQTPEAAEGLSSFKEKRAARWP